MRASLFFKGLSWLLVLNLLIKPVWIFAIDRQVQNILERESYGRYFALLNLTTVLIFIADAGLSNMVTQRLATKTDLDSKQLLKIKSLMLLVYGVACCFIGWFSGITAWEILIYLILIQTFSSLFLFLRGLLVAHQRFKTDAFFSVADKGLLIILCGSFIYGWWQPITLEIFLQLQLFSIGLACLTLLTLLLKNRLITSGRKEEVRKIILWTLPFASIILLMGVHYRLDGFLLERIHVDGAWQAGVYATAYRLLEAANMIGYLTASFIVAFVARNKNNLSVTRNVVVYSQHLLVLMAILAGSFAYVFAPWIQSTLYHTDDVYNSQVIQLTLLVLPACYLIHIYGSVLTALAAFKTFISILCGSVIINVILNVILIPGKGAVGCCIAALVSQYACAFACYLAVARHKIFTPSWKAWPVYVTCAAVFIFAFSFLKNVVHSVWFILAATGVLVIILAVTQTKLLLRLFSSFTQQKHA